MTARNNRHLPEATARAVVSHCLECLRVAGVPSPRFAASPPIEGFARAYDTLLLEFKKGQPLLVQPQPLFGPEIPPANLIHEALVLLHALSYCPRYAFHDNFAFWDATLTQASPAPGAMSAKPGVRFPRVVLDWVRRYHWDVSRKAESSRSLLWFDTSVVALLFPPYRPRMSSDGDALLRSIRAYRATTRENTPPIECVVAIPYIWPRSDSNAFVDSLISSKHRLGTTTASKCEWSGLHLCDPCKNSHADTIANLDLLRRLSMSLPASVSLESPFPYTATVPRAIYPPPMPEPLKAAFVSFLPASIGVIGTQLLGRLTVLDLRKSWSVSDPSFAVDFASLCTLLPHSRTLRKLCVAVSSNADLLWIAYAATHPLTPNTQWRTLHLLNYPHWPAELDRVVASSSVLSALWIELTSSSRPYTSTRNPEVLPDHYVRRTAKIAHNVPFFSPTKTKTFVQLVHGHEVELCDTTTPLDKLALETGDPDLDNVAVVVAGVGLGWVHKRHLTQLTDTRYEGTPRSYLTTLTLDYHDNDAADLETILSFLGQPLVHLRVVRFARLSINAVVRACPRLETVEIKATSWEVDDTTPVIPLLRYVGVVWENLASFDASLEWLQRLPRLNAVRMLFIESVCTVPWGAIDTRLSAFAVHTAQTLDTLTIIHTGSETPLAGSDESIACAASSKRAFLSVLRAYSRCQQGAVPAQLSSDIVAVVFGFAGPSLTRRVIKGCDLWRQPLWQYREVLA